jgi:ribonuclease BN (tRNA processing enzyme)
MSPARATPGARLDITVLGAADAFCSDGHLNAAYLFETDRSTFLVDCGPTVLLAMKQRGIDTARVDFVVVSHLHGDHFGGLPLLLLEYTYERPRERPLLIVGPPGMEERLWALYRALYRDVDGRALPFALHFQELTPETTTTVADVKIFPVRVPHQIEDTALALRFDAGGKRVLYSGDSPWVDRFIELANGVDLFLCECTAFASSMGRHIEYRILRPLVPKLGCRRLVLVHLGREMREHAAEIDVQCASEGMVIKL